MSSFLRPRASASLGFERRHVELLDPLCVDELVVDEELGARLRELQRVLVHERVALVGLVRILVLGQLLAVVGEPVVVELHTARRRREVVVAVRRRPLLGHVQALQAVVGDERVDGDAGQCRIVAREHRLVELATRLGQRMALARPYSIS